MKERDLFLAALEIEDPVARSAHLKAECADDAELLARVESLLASHEGQSQFLNTPVVAQLADESAAGPQGTILIGSGSTQDDEPGATAVHSPGVDPMTAPQDDSDDEIPLGYLESSTKPGSLGRLAHYEVLEVIGRGAFGIVLRAFDEKLQRVVAIKVMAPELASTSPARKRFLREAQASAAIRHENVVSIYAVEEKPIPYLVMEYIPGLTLQQRLDERGPLDIPSVLRLGRQMAEGLAAAHAQELIHRDIKPGNILLETGVQDRVKITDFGLARAADDASLTQSGTIAGTPMYMAPEQAMGQKLDQRADLFSFGSVMYQMVSGRPPFRAATTLAVLKRLAEDTPRPIREIIPEAPQWLCDIITKLHAKNPDQRYQTAREIADVLADCEAQLKAHAGLKDLSRIPRTKSPSAGWWKWIAAAVVVLPLVAFGLSAFNRPAAQPNVARNEIAEPATNPDPMKPVSETTPDEVTHPIAPESAGWVQLFNGKDLSGWKAHDLAPGNWRVEDGAIVGRGEKSFLSFLFSESEYADFHLRVEAKINAIGDSGVIFRAPFDVRLWDGGTKILLAGGYEAQIAVRSNYRVHTGSLFWDEPPVTQKGPPFTQKGPLMPNPPDEWFVLEVIAQGNRIQTFVNGKKTVDYVDEQRRYDRGHLALQTWGGNITVVQFRKIEIKELPSSGSILGELAKRRFGSDEWIDVIPLIDPQADKWNVPQRTGKNAWRIEQGELVVGGDTLASKLLLPLDSDWLAFECELEFTRRAGESGFNVNIPTKVGECPLLFDPAGTSGAFFGSRAKGVQMKTGTQLVTGKRATIRFDMRRRQDADHVSVALNGTAIGKWTGDRTAISYSYREGFPHDRRVSLWIQPGGNEFVFHRIRVRMLDGGTAESLRPVPNSPPVAVAKHEPLPPTFKNSIGMEFVIVPKGKSWLGGGQDKLGEKDVEFPADFYLGKYEVTQEEWERVMGENPSHFSRTGDGMDVVKDVPDGELTRFPVENIDWDRCQFFIAKLNDSERETGWIYRLPTLDEWEYACRGGPMSLPDRIQSAFAFYLDRPSQTLLTTQANFSDGGTPEAPVGLRRTCPVGSYPPNALGFFEMHGNVQEWCADTGVIGTDGKPHRLFRGGSYKFTAPFCAASAHMNGWAHSRFGDLGLRLARVPAGAPLPAANTSAIAPFTDADIQRIAALPAGQQVDEVRKELIRRNPGFDGKVEHKIEDGVVTELKLITDEIVDISPVRALQGLVSLNLSATSLPGKRGKLSDISPIRGLPVTYLNLVAAQVTNIEVVKDMPLTYINLDRVPVTDLSPLAGKALKGLHITGTTVKSLSEVPIASSESVHCSLPQISDKSELQRLGVRFLHLWSVPATVDPDRLRELQPLLSKVNGKPVEEFLKEVVE